MSSDSVSTCEQQWSQNVTSKCNYEAQKSAYDNCKNNV